jgi:hypothetical protein
LKQAALATDSIQPGNMVHDIARRLDIFAACHWQTIIPRHGPRLARVFSHRGAAAYDLWLRLLFASPARQLIAAGLTWYPRLPGHTAASREWLAHGESHRERWLAAALCGADGAPLGMLVTASHEGLDRFEPARRPAVFGLNCLGVEAVREELRRRASATLDIVPPGASSFRRAEVLPI